jgi:hypothetical protein
MLPYHARQDTLSHDESVSKPNSGFADNESMPTNVQERRYESPMAEERS